MTVIKKINNMKFSFFIDIRNDDDPFRISSLREGYPLIGNRADSKLYEPSVNEERAIRPHFGYVFIDFIMSL